MFIIHWISESTRHDWVVRGIEALSRTVVSKTVG